jgi:hypothetical protein
VRLRGQGDEGARELLDDLAGLAMVEHPLRPRLAALLGLQQRASSPRSLESILAGCEGVPLRDEPLEALELHLRQQRELVSLLEQRQEELVYNLRRSGRLLDLTAGVAVLLFLFGGLGWAFALGWLGVGDDPVVEELEEPEAPEGPDHRRRRP